MVKELNRISPTCPCISILLCCGNANKGWCSWVMWGLRKGIQAQPIYKTLGPLFSIFRARFGPSEQDKKSLPNCHGHTEPKSIPMQALGMLTSSPVWAGPRQRGLWMFVEGTQLWCFEFCSPPIDHAKFVLSNLYLKAKI